MQAPALTISVALLVSSGNRFSECHHDILGIHSLGLYEAVAWANIGFSVFSMCFGAIQNLSSLRDARIVRNSLNGNINSVEFRGMLDTLPDLRESQVEQLRQALSNDHRRGAE